MGEDQWFKDGDRNSLNTARAKGVINAACASAGWGRHMPKGRGLGLAFFFGSAVGMVRFPDFYTRMHAAGKGDTLSTMLMLAGFALVTMDDFSVESWLVFIKILAVILFIVNILHKVEK